jgi:DNA-binding SARP family transcriptional activator/Tfp pilus assembly protein PilF
VSEDGSGSWAVGILGALVVSRDGVAVALAGARRRALVCRLAVAGGHAVSAGQLAEDLWEGHPGPGTPATLQSHVSHLRRLLGPGWLVSREGGYALDLGAVEIDAMLFERETEAGLGHLTADDLDEAASLLASALGRWRGPALADVAGQLWAAGEVTRLEDLRLRATEGLLEARLALGEHDAVADAAEAAVRGHPLRERLWSLLMLALYRSGRQADALAAYQRLRRHLDDELGLAPGPDVTALQGGILRQDAGLDIPARATVLARAAVAARAVPVPRELPADVEGFTSREVELAELDYLLPVTGPPAPGAPRGPVVISAVAGTAGVGKTALAVRWAHRVADSFPDGQLYVNLRGYDPGQPMTATEALAGFLRSLGVAGAEVPLEEAERSARYRSLLAGKRVLVVLDNAATAEQVRPLLPGSPSVMVMVTSRDALAGLVARDGAHRLDLDVLPTADAATLLHTLIGPRADADPAATLVLAGQCARLPLALRVAAELAVARPDMPLAGLVAELAGQQDRLTLLDAGGDPGAAVASVFSWSYRHLPPDTGRMFRLLGLHPGADWDRYAAAALAGTDLAPAGQQLATLARAHLIQPAGAGRYGLHDLLRAYAAGLAARHDDEQARQAALTRLFDYYLAACAAVMDSISPADRHYRPDPPITDTPLPQLGDPAIARTWADAELGTLTTVATHTASRGWPGHATRLAATLMHYFDGGHYAEASILYSQALTAARDSGDRVAQARILAYLGSLLSSQGRYQQGLGYCQQALALAREIGDQPAQAETLNILVMAYDRLGRYRQAADCGRQALALCQKLGDQWGELWARQHLGIEAARQGRYRQAVAHFQKALTLSQQIGDRTAQGRALGNLGEVCYLQGEYQQAGANLRQSLRLARQDSDHDQQAECLTRLGEVNCRQGQYDQAAEYYQQALAVHRELGDSGREPDTLNGAGETYLATGQTAQASTCHTAALALARQSGNQREQARALTRLAEVSRRQGQHDQAAGYHRQALALHRELGDPGAEADALNSAGETHLAAGQPDQALTCHAHALTLARQTGARYQEARAQHGLAGAADATGDLSQARQHRLQALDLYASLGIPGPTATPAGQPGPTPAT